MYIGQLAKLTGCTPKAIRLYERIGLMPVPGRQGKYRVYTQHHVDVVQTIRIAQSAGVKLSELHGLIREKVQHERFPLDMALDLIVAKRAQVRAQLEALHAQDARLVQLRDQLTAMFAPPASPREGCELQADPVLLQQMLERRL